MTGYLMRTSRLEQALQSIEEAMSEVGITLTSYGGNGFTISFEDVKEEFWVQSISGERSTSLPRLTYDERLTPMR